MIVKPTMIEGDLISFTAEDVLQSLGMPPTHRFAEPIGNLVLKTKEIAVPKAFYMEFPIGKRAEKTVRVGDLFLCSDRLAENVKDSDVICPFLCTCGAELAEYGESLSDVTDLFAFDAIMEFYCRLMICRVRGQICAGLPEGYTPRCDYPGDLWGWEIRELKKLFEIFDSSAAEIGVSLSEYYMMKPLKTVAGVFYAVKDHKKECSVCSCADCPRREHPYSEGARLESLYRI